MARPSTQQGPALPLPRTTLRIWVPNLLLKPRLPPAGPKSHTSAAESTGHQHRCAGFPLNSQSCSARGIQWRDQGGQFHRGSPPESSCEGKNPPLPAVFRPSHWLEVGRNSPDKLRVLHPGAHQAGTWQTRDFGVSISARILHASKKRFPLFSFLPAHQRNPSPVSAVRGR